MEVLMCKISLANLQFDFVHEVEIESSWKEFTDKATIKLPAALKVDKNALKQAIPSGSKAKIELGYKSDGFTTVFEGYVARVRNKVPVEIECEDEMYQLKKIAVNDNCKNEKLGNYLQRVLGVEVDAYDVKVPSMVVNKLTGSQLLDRVRQEFGFNAYFLGQKLIVGKPYSNPNRKRHTIVIDNATDSNVKTEDLEYMSKEDVKIKVTAISNMASGKKEEYKFGDEDGEERTLNFYNIPETQLKELAEKEAEKLKYDGYRGNLTLFGSPVVFHGDILVLTNRQESDKTGEYFIDKVTYKFGIEGFQQTVEPGPVAKQQEQ